MTVRIRKVKCDEGRPACNRCITTGRACDGYGIWGGGDNSCRRRQCATTFAGNHISPRPPAPDSANALGTEDKGYFEWFRCRTATKLPGSFASRFWDTLLLQASLDEPAVLHAVLALSSTHKRGALYVDGQSRTDNSTFEQEKITIRHYITAISHLLPHFSTRNRASFRVALITCVAFICLEFLRGHFQTAQIHLQSGLKILAEIDMLSIGNNGIVCAKPCLALTDDWIVEAFSRLHLQMELFQHTHQHQFLLLQAAGPEKPVPVFRTVNDAWLQMGRLLNKVFHLTYQVRQQVACERDSSQKFLLLLEDQQLIRKELSHWLVLYETFKRTLRGHRSPEEGRLYNLLYPYHTMASIMVDTCLQPNDELAFDFHTDQFVLLIKQLAKLWIMVPATASIQPLPGDMSRSIVDMGWIPVLYYAAVKCRVHRLRLQAIRLLESTSHREGIWDAKTAACVARKVMEMEERDFYRDLDTADDFSLLSTPCPKELSLLTIPNSYRIRDVEVVLSGDPMDSVLIFCKQSKQDREGVDCRVLLSEYSVRLQCWIDGRHE